MIRVLPLFGLLCATAYGLGQPKPNLVGTYKPRFVLGKSKTTAEERKEMQVFEKYTRLIIQKPGHYVITDGVTAHDGLWHITNTQLAMKPTNQPVSSRVKYYISLDTKKLTPVLSSLDKPYIEWNRVSRSEKVPKR